MKKPKRCRHRYISVKAGMCDWGHAHAKVVCHACGVERKHPTLKITSIGGDLSIANTGDKPVYFK